MAAYPALLDEALEQAGGEARWRAVERISARVRSGGLLPRTRAAGNRFDDYRLTIALDRQYAELDPYPRPGLRAVLDGSEVRIEAQGGTIVERRSDPRERFFGLSGIRRNLRWDALDSAYFAGYAMWNYLAMPLLLTRPEVTVRAGPGWSGEGPRWRRLDATFDHGLETHSREQSFSIGWR